MFYCNDCAKKFQYPDTIGKSFGTCESCRRSGLICNDLPSSTLARIRENRERTVISTPVQEVVPTEEDRYFDDQRG